MNQYAHVNIVRCLQKAATVFLQTGYLSLEQQVNAHRPTLRRLRFWKWVAEHTGGLDMARVDALIEAVESKQPVNLETGEGIR